MKSLLCHFKRCLLYGEPENGPVSFATVFSILDGNQKSQPRPRPLLAPDLQRTAHDIQPLPHGRQTHAPVGILFDLPQVKPAAVILDYQPQVLVFFPGRNADPGGLRRVCRYSSRPPAPDDR